MHLSDETIITQLPSSKNTTQSDSSDHHSPVAILTDREQRRACALCCLLSFQANLDENAAEYENAMMQLEEEKKR